VRPATVAVALRACVPLCAATEKVTVPLPLPLLPPLMLSHDELSDAVHAHPLPADTLTVTEPPARETAFATGLTV
jgi:hypothetical protein